MADRLLERLGLERPGIEPPLAISGAAREAVVRRFGILPRPWAALGIGCRRAGSALERGPFRGPFYSSSNRSFPPSSSWRRSGARCRDCHRDTASPRWVPGGHRRTHRRSRGRSFRIAGSSSATTPGSTTSRLPFIRRPSVYSMGGTLRSPIRRSSLPSPRPFPGPGMAGMVSTRCSRMSTPSAVLNRSRLRARGGLLALGLPAPMRAAARPRLGPSRVHGALGALLAVVAARLSLAPTVRPAAPMGLRGSAHGLRPRDPDGPGPAAWDPRMAQIRGRGFGVDVRLCRHRTSVPGGLERLVRTLGLAAIAMLGVVYGKLLWHCLQDRAPYLKLSTPLFGFTKQTITCIRLDKLSGCDPVCAEPEKW